MSKTLSRVVFVGNIPYGLSEEQITDIFSSAGKVINFRLVYDRETGRPKGFGFAEYPDHGWSRLFSYNSVLLSLFFPKQILPLQQFET
ncbi:hypothetical protein VDGD_20345 [Verticillium dahliae]|nr:hypothetical protein VDGD_20345 [Verticillium dahliae]